MNKDDMHKHEEVQIDTQLVCLILMHGRIRIFSYSICFIVVVHGRSKLRKSRGVLRWCVAMTNKFWSCGVTVCRWSHILLQFFVWSYHLSISPPFITFGLLLLLLFILPPLPMIIELVSWFCGDISFLLSYIRKQWETWHERLILL